MNLRRASGFQIYRRVKDSNIQRPFEYLARQLIIEIVSRNNRGSAFVAGTINTAEKIVSLDSLFTSVYYLAIYFNTHHSKEEFDNLFVNVFEGKKYKVVKMSKLFVFDKLISFPFPRSKRALILSLIKTFESNFEYCYVLDAIHNQTTLVQINKIITDNNLSVLRAVTDTVFIFKNEADLNLLKLLLPPKIKIEYTDISELRAEFFACFR